MTIRALGKWLPRHSRFSHAGSIGAPAVSQVMRAYAVGRVEGVAEREPAPVRVAAQRGGVEAERVEQPVEPVQEGGPPVDGTAVVDAAARVAHDVDGVHAVGTGERAGVGEPHRRRGAAAVQQHQRLAVGRSADVDAGHAVRRGQVGGLDGDRPPREHGVIGREVLRAPRPGGGGRLGHVIAGHRPHPGFVAEAVRDDPSSPLADGPQRAVSAVRSVGTPPARETREAHVGRSILW
jgi:hypothetical protein